MNRWNIALRTIIKATVDSLLSKYVYMDYSYFQKRMYLPFQIWDVLTSELNI